MKPSEFIDVARSFIGVPFVHQGRNRFGVDCIGLAVATATEAKLLSSYNETDIYARMPLGDSLFDALGRYCIRTTKVAPANIVLIKWPGYEYGTHLAIITGKTMIHAYERSKQVVEQGYRDMWLRLTHSSWRLIGIEE